MTPIRLLPLILLLGLAACQATGDAPATGRSPPARPQEPDGGLGGTGNTDCAGPATDRRAADAMVPGRTPSKPCL